MRILLAFFAAVVFSCAHGMEPDADVCDATALLTVIFGEPGQQRDTKLFGKCFTKDTRVTSNSGVYWGIDAYDYLTIPQTGLGMGTTVSTSGVNSAGDIAAKQIHNIHIPTSDYDVGTFVVVDETGGALGLRYMLLDGKFRSFDTVWNYEFSKNELDAIDADLKSSMLAPIAHNLVDALCKTHGVADVITFEKLKSLRNGPANETFVIAHNTAACKIVHLAMFQLSVEEGRPNTNHCIHASDPPRPDSNGKMKCHDHYKFSYELFSESEVRAIAAMDGPKMVDYFKGEKLASSMAASKQGQKLTSGLGVSTHCSSMMMLAAIMLNAVIMLTWVF